MVFEDCHDQHERLRDGCLNQRLRMRRDVMLDGVANLPERAQTGMVERDVEGLAPALDLLRAIRGTGAFTICEGGIASPAAVTAAYEAGADSVVVGTAITNIDVLVQSFVAATPRRAKPT